VYGQIIYLLRSPTEAVCHLKIKHLIVRVVKGFMPFPTF
jgi:hypothetical protein